MLFKASLFAVSLGTLVASLAPAGPAAAASALIPTVACSDLKRALGSKVQSSGVEYNATSTNTWSTFNYDTPTCIVYASNAQDVKTAMTTIFRLKSPYAVRAGGHNPMVGWNNVHNGVLIDFSHMKDINYNAQKGSVTFGPGVRWGEVADALEPQGVAVVGGRNTDVGTGALLGGGISFLSPQYGYAADNILEVDVVLTDGTLVTANPNNKYSDLFKAIKGGANRFGIVTKYTVTAIKTGTRDNKAWFGGVIVWPGPSAGAVIKATTNYIKNNKDPKAVIQVLLNARNGVAPDAVNIALLFYNGAELPASIFGEFLAIPSAPTDFKPMSYYDVLVLSGPGPPAGFGNQNIGSAFVEEAEFTAGFAAWQKFTADFDSTFGPTYMILSPIMQSQIDAGKTKNGGNLIRPARAHASVAFAESYPPNALGVSAAIQAAREQFIKKVPNAPGTVLFANEIDKSQNVFKTYGGYDELKRTYKKYDPTGFNVKFQQGPILSC